MGFLIRFINNRDLAPENIMTAAVRSRVILRAPAGTLHSLFTRLRESNCVMPARSIVVLAQDLHSRILRRRPGEYALDLRPSRRNTMLCDGVTAQAPEVQAVIKRLRSLGYPSTYRPRLDQDMHVMIAGMCFCVVCMNLFCVPTSFRRRRYILTSNDVCFICLRRSDVGNASTFVHVL